jgi:predicted ATPase
MNQPVSIVEGSFLQSIQHARDQSALSWELRATTSLARLWADHSRCAEAVALLKAVYARFAEGFETADLKAARLLLAKLEKPTNRLCIAD